MRMSTNAERVYQTVKDRTGITDQQFCIEAFRTAQMMLAEIPEDRRPVVQTKVSKLVTVAPETAYRELKRQSSYESDRKMCLRILRFNQRLMERSRIAA